eukprot:Em0012g124a
MTQGHARILNTGPARSMATTTKPYKLFHVPTNRLISTFKLTSGDGCHSCELQSTLRQTLSCSMYPQEMNLGGIYQLEKDTDASLLDGSNKEDDDTSVDSDSSSVDDTDLAAGAILVPDFKNNPDQDDIFATPWGKEEHYLKYFPRQTRPSDRYYAIMMS